MMRMSMHGAMAGDFILSVNGIRDSVDAMKADLGSKETLELIVAPFTMVLKKNPEQSEEQASATTDVTVKIENKKAIDLGLQVQKEKKHTKESAQRNFPQNGISKMIKKCSKKTKSLTSAKKRKLRTE
eukprot:3473301-Amphidinium_carterae.1